MLLENTNDQKLNFVENKNDPFDPLNFYCETRDGHSKPERMEITDQHLKTRFCFMLLLKAAAIFQETSVDMSRYLSKALIPTFKPNCVI